MLELNHLNAYYGDSHILQGIQLHIPAQGRVAVLGRNGAGKSTLFKSIMAGGPRVHGTITLDGHDLSADSTFARARRGLALVPEDRRIFSHLSVRENLKLAEQALPQGREPILLEEVLRYFPMLSALQERYGNQLSGGQQQMLAVARGVASRPGLLLLDEPTEGLAPVIVQELANSVRQVCERFEMGLLLAEQHLWFARQCTDYLYVLDTGRVVFEGDWGAFDRDADVKNRYLAV